MTKLLGSVFTAMATAFDADDRLDLAGCVRLASYLVEHGSDGLVLSGTTGESPTLSDDEKIALWGAIRQALPKTPIVVGSTTSSTSHSVELTKAAQDLGADAVLGVVPYYSRPSQEGIFRHFSAILAATELPVILYDIPVRTGRKAASDTIVALSDSYGNLVGVKDAAGNVSATGDLIQRLREDVVVYSGDDALTLALLAVGAKGVISVASHWAGRVFGEMIRAFMDGEVARATEINGVLMDSYHFQSQESAPNPTPLKAMLEVLGLPGGGCRLPLCDPDDELRSQASKLYGKLVEACTKLGIAIEEEEFVRGK